MFAQDVLLKKVIQQRSKPEQQATQADKNKKKTVVFTAPLLIAKPLPVVTSVVRPAVSDVVEAASAVGLDNDRVETQQNKLEPPVTQQKPLVRPPVAEVKPTAEVKPVVSEKIAKVAEQTDEMKDLRDKAMASMNSSASDLHKTEAVVKQEPTTQKSSERSVSQFSHPSRDRSQHYDEHDRRRDGRRESDRRGDFRRDERRPYDNRRRDYSRRGEGHYDSMTDSFVYARENERRDDYRSRDRQYDYERRNDRRVDYDRRDDYRRRDDYYRRDDRRRDERDERDMPPPSRSRSREHHQSRRGSRHEQDRRGTPARQLSLQEELEKLDRTVGVYNLGSAVTGRDLREFFDLHKVGPVTDSQIVNDPRTRISKGLGYVELKTVAAVDQALDLTGQQLQGKPVIVRRTDDEKELLIKQIREQPDAHILPGLSLNGAVNSTRQQQQQQQQQQLLRQQGDKVLRTLKVDHLHPVLGKDELQAIFGEFGPVTTIDLRVDANGQSTGTATVTFKNTDDARTALEGLHGFELAGKYLQVTWHQDMPPQAVRRLVLDDGTDSVGMTREELTQRLARSRYEQ